MSLVTSHEGWLQVTKILKENPEELAAIPTETLNSVIEEAKELKFIANMSDDYSVTQRELSEIANVTRPVREELNRRERN